MNEFGDIVEGALDGALQSNGGCFVRYWRWVLGLCLLGFAVVLGLKGLAIPAAVAGLLGVATFIWEFRSSKVDFD